MKKILLVSSLLLGLTGCVKSGSVPTPDESPVPEQTIDVKNLISLENGDILLNEGSPSVVTEISLSFSNASNNLVKKIVLTNTSAVSKNLDVKILNNEKMIISASTCGSILEAGKNCSFFIRHHHSGLTNGVYTGTLNVSQDQNAQAAIVSTLNHPSLEIPTPTGATVLSHSFMGQSYDSYVSGDSGVRILKVTNSSPTQPVNNISFSLNSLDFSISYSSCPSSLKPEKACYVRVVFVNKKIVAAPPANLKLDIFAGSQSQSVNLVSPPLMTGISVSPGQNIFNITGSNLQFVNSVKILQGATEIDSLLIDSKTNSILVLKMSKNINLQSGIPYIFRLE